MRQIDADALQKALANMWYDSPISITGLSVSKLIDEQPTIEAETNIIRCKECIFYDPPHVEKEGIRFEYQDMPADAFDKLGTRLVTIEYGINVGGRCCRDYIAASYSEDKRVFVPETNYCGRAEKMEV